MESFGNKVKERIFYITINLEAIINFMQGFDYLLQAIFLFTQLFEIQLSFQE